MQLLSRLCAAVALVDRDLPDVTWQNLLCQIRSMGAVPRLILILPTGEDGAICWAEALNQGVYDVLSKPLGRAHVMHAVGLAWLHGKQLEQVTVGSTDVSPTDWSLPAQEPGSSQAG